ncbi:uncharacterized protein MELLADRAFT_106789 [Melampsora larici-populina 98AG31]|uniref:Uncharacterized protein n=1 Tax=Melampsora larici-populina (strain 98AG31 / pathotype 3-4-7) TaxID=747676 RepID=F4RMM9_MELLP|nr:uncharacterized protein MELLADRAFT_106789 [Melampsora larici-populina 98AG31]EGG06140.1 hypothetical protein MELLADRAFT_106789 [Melampsora larici-populina 98AG31]
MALLYVNYGARSKRVLEKSEDAKANSQLSEVPLIARFTQGTQLDRCLQAPEGDPGIPVSSWREREAPRAPPKPPATLLTKEKTQKSAQEAGGGILTVQEKHTPHTEEHSFNLISKRGSTLISCHTLLTPSKCAAATLATSVMWEARLSTFEYDQQMWFWWMSMEGEKASKKRTLNN